MAESNVDDLFDVAATILFRELQPQYSKKEMQKDPVTKRLLGREQWSNRRQNIYTVRKK